MILYEYPLNERTRTYLRLEHLLQRLGQLVPREHPLDHHHALQTLFEILEVGARADLKSEILKDLERHKHVFEGYRGNPAISEAALEQLIARIDRCYAVLRDDEGRPGHALAGVEWLQTVRNRMAIPGGTCGFDVPAYHDWQHRPPAERQADLARWAQEVACLAEPVHLLLQLLRESAIAQKVYATQGQFQQNLPQSRTFQLLRVWLDPALQLIPEISGNRLLVAVRLLRRNGDGRLEHAADAEAEFEIHLCH
ncbi:MAG: cell division protein ZapD [Tepidimonas ignava]|uniref:Cell division protein ZapD n=1 Tax=Tepidimonas ignava TaxID=114249 RepID=A0A4V2UV56_9BURK|nr:cell division protein ZapD [Tepidimonas ignava]MCX7815008.1 cell division protein ZapD [Tepidimonas ignava]TCS94447.1 cell division protein ZapD [Tepidimonas ignava]TSE22417.1 Cell division protein ZapD [Tepidimonas ignava]